jgi:hypothetical protein
LTPAATARRLRRFRDAPRIRFDSQEVPTMMNPSVTVVTAVVSAAA